MNIGNVEASTAKATAIILPTAAATDQTKMDLTFTLAGKTFTHSIADLTAFEAGKNVTFGVKLSVNNGKPVVTVGNATIKDWAEVPGGDFDVNFGGEGGGTEPGEEKVLFQETFGKPEKNGKYWPYLTDYTGFDNPATMFENVSTEKASVRANEGLGNVWFPAGKEVAIAIKGINVQGATTATLECEVGANVYKAGESQDLNTLKVVCNQKELVFPSKIVSGDNKEGNKPFKLVIENVSISEDTRLEFSASAATNTYGLRLFSVKLYVPGEGGGTVDPTPEPEPEPEPQPQPQPGANLLVNPGFEDWTEKLPTAWDNTTYNTGEITKETSIKHGGNNSLRQTSASSTNKVQQEVAITGGKKYKISYWFLDNDTKASSRYWFALVDAGNQAIKDLNSTLQQTDYSKESADWQHVEIEFTAPANAVKLRYEVRTYKQSSNALGGYIYYDDMSLEEVK